MEQETRYTTALSAPQSFALDGASLTITAADVLLRLMRLELGCKVQHGASA